MFILFDVNNHSFVEFENIDLYNIYLRYMAIPRDKNAKAVFDGFEIMFGIDDKVPVFMVLEKEKTLSTGVIIVNDYIKNKLIKKLYKELYDLDAINIYKELPANTVAYTELGNIDTKEMILAFLMAVENIEL